MKKLISLLFIFISVFSHAENLDIPISDKNKDSEKNNQYLQDWAARNHVGTTPVYFLVSSSTAQSKPNAAVTLVSFENIVSDTSSAWDASNNRFVVPTTGYYLFTTTVYLASLAADKFMDVQLQVNGIAVALSNLSVGGSGYAGCTLSVPLKLNQYDYVDVKVYQGDTTARNTHTDPTTVYFTGIRLF